MTLGCIAAKTSGATEYQFLKGDIVLQEWNSMPFYRIDHISAKAAGSGYTCQARAKDDVEVVMEAANSVTLTLGKMSELYILIFVFLFLDKPGLTFM